MLKILKIILIALTSFLIIITFYMVISGIYGGYVMKKSEHVSTPAGQIVVLDGAKIHYEIHGSGEPVLIIHGFLGSTDNFRSIVPELSQNYKVILVDNIGFGHSDKNPDLDFSKKAMAEKIVNLIKYLGFESLTVAGHSMGGEVAINIALDHPEMVDKLILIDSAGYTGRQDAKIECGFARDIAAFIIDKIIFTYPFVELTSVFYEEKNREIPKERKYEYFTVAKLTDGHTLLRISDDDDSGSRKDEISDLGMPVFIIWGEKDKIIPLEQGYNFNNDISGSELFVIPHAGHLPFDENKTEFINIINKILKQ